MGLGFVGMGVTVVLHTQGSSVDVPAGAPFIDHVIWITSVVCLLGGVPDDRVAAAGGAHPRKALAPATNRTDRSVEAGSRARGLRAARAVG
jgi:hypothetical protein